MKRNDCRSLVYSTDGAHLCPACGRQADRCRCAPTSTAAPGDGIVTISRQTKGRKGSGVCLISGLPLAPGELAILARRLKQRCGTGGTVKNGVIEIQGDHRAVLAEILRESGYRVKLSGG